MISVSFDVKRSNATFCYSCAILYYKVFALTAALNFLFLAASLKLLSPASCLWDNSFYLREMNKADLDPLSTKKNYASFVYLVLIQSVYYKIQQ